jgi:hypothetical protein
MTYVRFFAINNKRRGVIDCRRRTEITRVMDALAKIKKRLLLNNTSEATGIRDHLRSLNVSKLGHRLSAVAFSGAKLIESRDKALQGQ